LRSAPRSGFGYGKSHLYCQSKRRSGENNDGRQSFCLHRGRRERVLLIDIDPQGNSTSGVGINKEASDGTIYHALLRGSGLKEIVQKTALAFLDVVTSNTDLIGAEVELIQEKDREKKLDHLIKEVEADYEYIFIDCLPPWACSPLTLSPLPTP